MVENYNGSELGGPKGPGFKAKVPCGDEGISAPMGPVRTIARSRSARAGTACRSFGPERTCSLSRPGRSLSGRQEVGRVSLSEELINTPNRAYQERVRIRRTTH